jgi:hypothetical protein
MIIGEVTVYRGDADCAELQEPTMIELIDLELPFVEIAFQIGRRRVYLKFRKSDLDREIKEARSAS